MGRVVRLEGSGKLLGSYLRKVIMNKKHLCFLIQMINGSHFHATDGYAKGRVLDSVHFIDVEAFPLLALHDAERSQSLGRLYA